ncbi:hypothetical protein BHE74_00054500 [Ensete ventricosum]|nr:hypothetical protein GW17_00012155 [Ensete ventricosum]RWW40108.1 hypothetical protein BHE74_00054500 [Ensete ventricosum]
MCCKESLTVALLLLRYSVRVSNELGSGRPRATRYAVFVVLVQSLAIGLLSMAIILATRNQFSVIFTSDRDMQRAVADIAYLLGITMVLNSIQPVISGKHDHPFHATVVFRPTKWMGCLGTGVAVGGGWQALVAYINLGCYYIFGLPLGLSAGNLVWYAVWHVCPDPGSPVHNLEHRLEEGGKNLLQRQRVLLCFIYLSQSTQKFKSSSAVVDMYGVKKEMVLTDSPWFCWHHRRQPKLQNACGCGVDKKKGIRRCKYDAGFFIFIVNPKM